MAGASLPRLCMMVVVWDAATGQPLRTLANPHPAGVALMDVSADGQWLVRPSPGCVCFASASDSHHSPAGRTWRMYPSFPLGAQAVCSCGRRRRRLTITPHRL
jgi:hypothetical protein